MPDTCNYHKLTIWKKAVALGKKLRSISEGQGLNADTNIIIRGLLESTAELPLSIAMGCMEVEQESHLQVIRTVFDHAHRIEYYLFLSQLHGYYPPAEQRSFLRDVWLIKRHLCDYLHQRQTKGEPR